MSTFESIEKRIHEIARVANFSKEETELILKHVQVHHTVLNVNGESLPAWRIIHSNALGPGKGGIRFHPEVSEDEVKSLSFWMSLKNSLVGLPYGGGKGGIKFNPKGKSNKELEVISRAYIDAFYEHIGQDKDIPAPDVYTDSQVMAWMLDEYEKKVGHHEPGMITGKPVELGGISLRFDSTAHGGYIVFTEMIKSATSAPSLRAQMVRDRINNHSKSSGFKIAIQGFGNAGANMMKYLSGGGYRVVAVSDSKGGIYDPGGLDYKGIVEAKKESGSVISYFSQGMGAAGGSTKQITNEELLELDVDVLVLAALENQITKDNADKIKAKYIIELANGPITPEADKVLFEKGITVIPDILANAGGVVVSYFEWAQNRTGNILDEKYLEEKLIKIMTEAWIRVSNLAKKYGGRIDLRTAAYIIALRRILAAEKYRGNL